MNTISDNKCCIFNINNLNPIFYNQLNKIFHNFDFLINILERLDKMNQQALTLDTSAVEQFDFESNNITSRGK